MPYVIFIEGLRISQHSDQTSSALNSALACDGWLIFEKLKKFLILCNATMIAECTVSVSQCEQIWCNFAFWQTLKTLAI